MRAYPNGSTPHPAAAVVGIYDPVLPEHDDLFRQLNCYARQHSLSPVAIVMHPAPATFIDGATRWPVYSDITTRAALIRGCGLDVLRIRFSRRDIDAVAVDFFRVVLPHLRLSELWLGHDQSLGTGPEGAEDAILRLADQHGIEIKRLPHVRLRPVAKEIRKHLMAGRPGEAMRLIGRPPMRSRPRRDDPQRLAWPPGLYRAVPLAHPSATVDHPEIRVRLWADADGLARLQWPDRRVKYLAFVAGPGDTETRERRNCSFVRTVGIAP